MRSVAQGDVEGDGEHQRGDGSDGWCSSEALDGDRTLAEREAVLEGPAEGGEEGGGGGLARLAAVGLPHEQVLLVLGSDDLQLDVAARGTFQKGEGFGVEVDPGRVVATRVPSHEAERSGQLERATGSARRPFVPFRLLVPPLLALGLAVGRTRRLGRAVLPLL